jgi:hypothetical protein
VLVTRGGRRLKVGEAVLWSFTWGLGTALGVALGGWLTLVGGSGAPGTAALDTLSDLVLLPGGALVLVFGVHLAVSLIAAALRGRAMAGAEIQGDHEREGDDSVVG